MQRWQPVAILVLALAAAGAAGWALVERSARLAADARAGTRTASLEGRLQELSGKLGAVESSVAALEKWRSGAEHRLAAAGKRREGLPFVHRRPRGDGNRLRHAFGDKRTRRFSVKDKDGRPVSVSLLGAARLDEDLARELGLDAEKCKKVSNLIHKDNELYAQRLAARAGKIGEHRINFAMGGGDDGWVDFVNGKLRKLLDEKARRELLARFPRRCTMHMVTRGPLGDDPRVLIRPLLQPPERPGEPGPRREKPPPEQPAPPEEQF